jgi:hypothetical protein
VFIADRGRFVSIKVFLEGAVVLSEP